MFSFSHGQEHEDPFSRGANPKRIREQASTGIIMVVITARIIQPSTTNQQSSFQSGPAIAFQVDC